MWVNCGDSVRGCGGRQVSVPRVRARSSIGKLGGFPENSGVPDIDRASAARDPANSCGSCDHRCRCLQGHRCYARNASCGGVPRAYVRTGVVNGAFSMKLRTSTSSDAPGRPHLEQRRRHL
jgi:hypothetical protein